MTRPIDAALVKLNPIHFLNELQVAEALGITHDELRQRMRGYSMPAPVKDSQFRGMRWWDRVALERWIVEGCPSQGHVPREGAGLLGFIEVHRFDSSRSGEVQCEPA